MLQLLQILKVFMMLVPMVRDAVKAVEDALPMNGVGQQKLAMVREMIEKAFGLATDLSVTFEQVWPMVEKMIALMVLAYNETGMFKRTDPPK